MTRNSNNNPLTLFGGAALALALCAGSTLAADNYFLPHGINNWNIAGNWSLGHCPGQLEDVFIEVTSSASKIVNYNWTGISDFNSVTVDGDGGIYYSSIIQAELTMRTTNLYMSNSGDAYYLLRDPAFLWVSNNLYVGYSGTDDAYFELDTVADPSAGLYVGHICYVGYHAPGEFQHLNGFAEVDYLYIGQGDPGIYELKGTTAGSILTNTNQFVLGNSDVGTFNQTGGTFDQTSASGLLMGLNTGGEGTYNMKGGELNLDHISIAWNGDGYFNQTGGVVNVVNSVIIGCEGTHPYRAWVKVDDTDDEPTLNIGGDLLIGPQTLAKYEQLGSGTVNVTGDIEIWDGDDDPYASSYLYMGLDADWLGAAGLTNHSGYYDQDGGTLSVTNFTNDSEQGINLDNTADCRVRYLTHNAGTFQMWRTALLRGPYAGGGDWWLCNFDNNATFQMGNASFNGGTFQGILTNNGTFNYYQGNCTGAKIINEGTFNLYGDIECLQVVNNAYSMTIPTDRWVTATGENAPNAFENANGCNLTMQPRAHIDVGNDSVFVNNGNMYAGGAGSDYAHIYGDVENNGYLLPTGYMPDVGRLYVNGNYTASSSAELRIRLRGTDWTQHDQLLVQGSAHLAGELDVRLDGYNPALGDYFDFISFS
ncbi:MAG: hypothetical protein KAS72_15815, partial [Phycisphaerales bacterium]|nr:hypothetical protein [Phycisphaerales bacterium]